MQHRERFISLINRRKADRRGFWLGNPAPQTMEAYNYYFQVSSHIELSKKIGDDFFWIPADILSWKYPDGENVFDRVGKIGGHSHGVGATFAECESIREIENYKHFPDPDIIDYALLDSALTQAEQAGLATVSGAWSCFFHVVSDYFGMEEYFCKMHTQPKVVEALTEKVVDLFIRINENILSRFSERIDCIFMGNDFGSQLDLLISPECFRKFILPYYRKLISIANKYQKPVMLHSCGAISRIIPDLINAGISALHPLQALAKGMDANNLAQYKDDLLFVGGIDTQRLLTFGSPVEIKKEVFRIAELWGDGWIVSPSHEAILNVSAENLCAMRDAALELG